MSSTITVTWASIGDKLDNDTFAAERWSKVKSMVREGKTNGVVANPLDAPTASMTFTTQQDAEEWKTFIQDLAVKYNKSITNIQIQ